MTLKEPYSTLLYIALGVLLAFGINNGLALALSTSLPIVAVESNSMVPTFRQGDILLLQGKQQYNLHDVIVFSPTPDATPVVHRIIRINEDGTYQTKGDANANQLPFERSIASRQIHGAVILILPLLGWIKIGIIELVLPNIMWLAGVVIFLYIVGLTVRYFWRR